MPVLPPLPDGLDCACLPRAHDVPAQAQLEPWLATRLGTVALARDARGRPRLAEGDADVNWSHSGDLLLVALARGGQVGVDVERERPRARAVALARRFFAPAEADWLQALPAAAREVAFVRLWCAKEALLKAHGHGLSFGLHKAVFGERDGVLHLLECDALLGAPEAWFLREWAPAPGYRAALAWRRRA
ncbi:MAG TPA: 4'-phosphopantetheinyl transferase superfamily protein [Xanthomonadaceae bacterium]|jgi:4'-phosphopantetheinyl transferase|nr:4'-phosphopantetheinyl transferase superfamily protein [Xanthomonadaceae bacterium]